VIQQTVRVFAPAAPAGPTGTAAALVRACHPEPTAAVTVGSALLALVVGHRAAGVALVGGTILASQLCTGWSNDWRDADRDAAAGRADKPVAAGVLPRRTVGAGALLAGAAFVALSLATGWYAAGWSGLRWAPAVVIWVGLAGALAYNFRLKATPLSPLPYLVSFGCLGAFPVLALPAPTPVPWWLPLGTGLLGGGAHFLNVLPDLADDARTGVRGLPHRLGPAGCWVAAAGLLLPAGAVLAFGPPGRPGWAALALFAATALALPLGAYAAGRRPGSRAAFRAVLVIALCDAVLLLIAGPAVG
jgi:protoheme IX farnesyltransferase